MKFNLPVSRMSTATNEVPSYYKYISLVSLTVQNTLNALTISYVRSREGPMFFSTSAVVVSEIIKLFSSLFLILKENSFSMAGLASELHDKIYARPLDCLKISVPSIIYVMQNNLLYVALSNLDAATFQVTYQLKILTTALFSVFLLNKKLSREQWASLLLLFVGVSMVQLQNVNAKASAPKPTTPSPMTGEETAAPRSALIGFMAILTAALMSGFAGVYFEKILKGSDSSVWIRNVQLSVIGVGIGLVTAFVSDGSKISEHGFLYAYDAVVWFAVLIQSVGGILVAIVVKYADNVLKGFATSAAIVLAFFLSVLFLNFQASFLFIAGTILVTCATYIYSAFPPPPNVPVIAGPGVHKLSPSPQMKA